MPNYNLVINSQFQPFSYERYMQPYLLYDKAYREIEDAYNDINTKASIWDGLINKEQDPEIYAKYQTFSDNLKKEMDALNKGLDPTSRRRLLDMKSRYSKDIVPIEQAYAARQKQAEEQQKAILSDPTLMFSRAASTTKLGDYVNNPQLGYKVVSGNELYKKGMDAAKAASSRMQEILPALSGQYWQIREGYGAEAANKFLLDNDSIPELKDAIDRIVNQSNVGTDNMDRARDYALSGIMSGLTYDSKYQANRAYMSPADAARLSMERERLNMQKDEHEWARAQKEEQLKGVELPDKTRLKPIGGGRVLAISPDGSYKVVSSSSSGNDTLAGSIKNQAKVADTPIIIANTKGKWRIGKEGEDVPKTLMGMTRSNLVSTWGNYSLDNLSESIPIESINELPQGAAEQIVKAIKDNNLDIEKYTIVKVKAEKDRNAGNYDYVLVPKNQVTEQNIVNKQNNGL